MSKEQTKIGLQLNAKNYLCLVARSAQDAIKIIEGYLNGSSKNTE